MRRKLHADLLSINRNHSRSRKTPRIYSCRPPRRILAQLRKFSALLDSSRLQPAQSSSSSYYFYSSPPSSPHHGESSRGTLLPLPSHGTAGDNSVVCPQITCHSFSCPLHPNTQPRKVWHNPVHERDEAKESPSLRKCFEFLDLTSRSFSAVIKELHPELLVPICIFYLILRGLDTIEDDMTIDLAEKEPLLRNFDQILEKDGWTYDGNHAREKDRDLLVEFHYVITEFKKLKPEYQDIIRDITKRMGDGMAEYANNVDHIENGVQTIADYEQYCHYVAGLVGEGLTRLFVQANLANPTLLKRTELHESMGQFLQQVNIIRDIREDWEDKRRFYPKEIWSKYVDNFDELLDPKNKEKAMNCSSEMVLTALTRAPDCLFYLAGLRDQSIFNFCAIPQSMAIATLDLCFRNPDLFQRNVKISKGQACVLMLESTQNLQTLCETFKRYARKIHKKNDPRDPNFLEISIACGKVSAGLNS
jgi:farnesyl-diphosphate farnesyltransferase